jgi:hypothetical protein
MILAQQHFTSQHFRDALLHHIDESKPDQLVRSQMMNLKLLWEPSEILQQHEHAIIKENRTGNEGTFWISGKLTLTSEYISVIIYAKCQWHISQNTGETTTTDKSVASTLNTLPEAWNKDFQNEFYFRLGATALLVPLTEYNKSTEKSDEESEKYQKIERKERSMNRKLRSNMVKRLCDDPMIRQILVEKEEAASAPVDGVLLCEALIQRNETSNKHTKCEERVNVNSETIEAIRNAILSHCEDNLDILEILLSMPYLPRVGYYHEKDKNEHNIDNNIKSEETLKALSRRAFLCILEDAMFDACEKEGEDEMLDDLNLSDARYELEPNIDRKQHKKKKKV